jgi:hypothetical protein
VTRAVPWIRARPALALFPLVFAAYVFHFLLDGYHRFYHDSSLYWELGRTFERDGDFSLFNYDNSLRGYSLPLFNWCLQRVAAAFGLADVTVAELAGASLAATLGVVVLPRLARRLFSSGAVTWPRILALNALVFLFWRDHFNFPLTDFPALLAAAVGLLGLLRRTSAGYLTAGVGFGLAANLRPAYLPVGVLVVCAAAVLSLRASPGKRGLGALLVVLGVAIVSVPQALVNHHLGEGWSPNVKGGRDVAMVQLTAGLLTQRYETYIGPRREYPKTRVFYLDPFALPVAEEEGISEGARIGSYGEYLAVVARHPLELSASYALHVFNGFDVWFPTPYVWNLDERNWPLSLLQYSLVFGALLHLLSRELRLRLVRVSWLGVAILATPTLSAVPGAIEPRFFLPLHALTYMLVCFSPALSPPWPRLSSARALALGACYVAFVATCATLSTSTRAHIEAHPAGVEPAFIRSRG